MEKEYKDIYQLEKEFDNLSDSDSKEYLRFYKDNTYSIENIDIDKDEDHYNARLSLECEYGVSLVGAGYKKKGAEVLGKAITLFENAPNQDLSKLHTLPYFEQLLWNYGFALYETNQFNKAYTIFKRLDRYFNHDGKYKMWVLRLLQRRLQKISSPITYVIFVWVVLTFTLFKRFESMTRLYLAIILLLLVITSVSTLLYTKMLNRKARMHNTKYKQAGAK